jgi:excinuclease ABC subunit C
MFEIEKEVSKIPTGSGVYIMKDASDSIIYVGKAKNLKNRVSQYFRHSSLITPKAIGIYNNTKSFEYILTDTELEALILECNLIKENTPKYNTLLKDDKAYPYIKITLNEKFPRVFITKKHLNDKAKYYGPYFSSQAVKETLSVISKIFPVRDCHINLPKDIGKTRACLNYHIGICKAPCIGLIDEVEYSKIIEAMMNFLNGNYKEVIEELKQKMKRYSDNLEFESAAKVRDQINYIAKLDEKQKMQTDLKNDQDVIGIAKAENESVIQVFFVRGGRLISRDHFILNNVEDMTEADIMSEFIKLFYTDTSYIPREIITSEYISDCELIEEHLSLMGRQRTHIIYPRRGDKLKLVNMAVNNAVMVLRNFLTQLKREHQKSIGAVEDIQKALNLKNTLDRIEAYDISNTQGVESVGSMIVLEKGKIKKNDYRKFKIKTVKGANDFASIQEVIHRRFARYLKEYSVEETTSFNTLPQLIFIDGGTVQVDCAKQALRDLNISIPVCGLIKDDRHRTKSMLYENNEITLDKHSEGFKLITRIQDEMHRFAIAYHRKLRSKRQLQSVLDDIKGIGRARRIALLRHYGDIDKIRKATVADLCKVDTINKSAADSIYKFFHS